MGPFFLIVVALSSVSALWVYDGLHFFMKISFSAGQGVLNFYCLPDTNDSPVIRKYHSMETNIPLTRSRNKT